MFLMLSTVCSVRDSERSPVFPRGLGLNRVWEILRDQPIKFRVASLNKIHTVSSSSLPLNHSHPCPTATKGKTMAEVKLDAKVFHRRAKGLLSFWKVSPPRPPP
jgi:hypothetical protein